MRRVPQGPLILAGLMPAVPVMLAGCTADGDPGSSATESTPDSESAGTGSGTAGSAGSACPDGVWDGDLFVRGPADLVGMHACSQVAGSVIVDPCVNDWPPVTNDTGGSCSGGEAVTSLEPLSNLVEIEGDLVIGWASLPPESQCSGHLGLRNLAGLDGLEAIGGKLSLGCTPDLNSLAGLEQLTAIGGDLDVACDVEVNLASHDLPSLTTLSGLSGLTTLGGDLGLCADALVDIRGLSSLRGEIGRLWVTSDGLQDFSGLEGVTSITGEFVAASVRGLRDLTGLQNVEHLGGLDIEEASSLERVDLPNLATVEQGLSIGIMPALTEVRVPMAVTTVEGIFSVGFAKDLTVVEAPGLASTGGRFWIEQTGILTLGGLSGLATVGEDLIIAGNTNLPTSEAEAFAANVDVTGETVVAGNGPG